MTLELQMPKDLPAGHELLCKCMHTQKEHKPGEGSFGGRCAVPKCGCIKFTWQGKAQMKIENPAYKPKPPKAPSWYTWRGSFLRRWVRNAVGVTEDMDAGTLFMQITGSNIQALTQLVRGLRTDLDAANNQQNPVNEVVIELERRLQFYESEKGTGLALSYKRLMSIDAKQKEREDKARAAAELEAANERIRQRKLAVESGEFMDCPSCKGSGYTNDGQDTCPECAGNGVVPNPDYVPESEYSEEGVKRHLHLEG